MLALRTARNSTSASPTTQHSGMDVDITEIEDKLTPAALPFHPLVADGCNALMKVRNTDYSDTSPLSQ